MSRSSTAYVDSGHYHGNDVLIESDGEHDHRHRDEVVEETIRDLRHDPAEVVESTGVRSRVKVHEVNNSFCFCFYVSCILD